MLSTELVEESSCIQGLGINTVLVSHYKDVGGVHNFITGEGERRGSEELASEGNLKGRPICLLELEMERLQVQGT